MRNLRETRTVTLSRTPERTVEGVVQVRGFDVRTSAFEARAERHEPVEVIVTEGGQERRYRMPGESRATMAVLAVAAPLVARAVARMLKSRRSR